MREATLSPKKIVRGEYFEFIPLKRAKMTARWLVCRALTHEVVGRVFWFGMPGAPNAYCFMPTRDTVTRLLSWHLNEIANFCDQTTIAQIEAWERKPPPERDAEKTAPTPPSLVDPPGANG